MDDRLEERLEAALRQLPTVQASPGLPDRVVASIRSQSSSIWDLATLGRPMALGASLTFLTILFSVFAYQLWVEMEGAGTLAFANLLLLDAEARSQEFSNLLAAFWESLPLASLIVVLAILALYVVPIKVFAHSSGGSRATIRMAGRH